jgi:hypothetical protein
MGLCGGKETYVASTVYNLAGAEAERVSFLKTTVVGNIIGSSGFTMADTIRNVFLSGPGISGRGFFRWALNNYQGLGVPKSSLGGVFNMSAESVAAHVPKPDGYTVQIQSVEVGPIDYSWWAEQWLITNRTSRLTEDWTADTINGGTQIRISYADGTSDTFTPTGMDPAGTYVYVVYSPVDPGGVAQNSVYWIYKVGSGNAVLDAAVSAGAAQGDFFPVIPFRHENKFLSSTYMPAAYELAKKAYRKASGRRKYSEMVDKIAENPSLGDIDHAYMAYGVCLNVKEKACREYIFRLFKRMAPGNTSGGTTSAVPLRSLRVRSSGSLLPNSLDMEIRWSAISLIQGSGLVRPNVYKRGDYWIEKSGVQPGGSIGIIAGTIINISRGDVGKITIYWQKTDTSWEAVEISGLVHYNHIYRDKSVKIGAHEALDDPDDTGFIVPLHYPTVRQMSLAKSTQMMTASTFMVFNSYKVVKQKWYQTGIFKIFVFVLMIVIVVVFPPAGGAVAAGLGAIAATAIGLTGILAIIVAVAINALVAMIVSKILGAIATEIFGEKWGAIIGAVLTMITMVAMGPLTAGQGLSAVWANMMNPVNIIGMTNAVLGGVQGYMQASAAQWGQKTQNMMESYEKQMKEIQDKLSDLLGNSRGMINPMQLTDAGSLFIESEEQFLSRTLMTGPDIANMTLDMLTNFAEYTTSLPKAN